MKKIIFFLVCSSLVFASVFLVTCSKNSDNNNGKPVFPVDCATSLAGTYTGSDICSSSGQTTAVANIVSNTPNYITITYLYGAVVTATVNCLTNQITIPTQTFGSSFSISGTGTYTANRIIINWTGNSLGSPLNCSTVYTR